MQNLLSGLRTGVSLFVLLFAMQYAVAQTAVIRGKIQDATGTPVTSANVLLLNEADSSLVKGTISDMAGRYVLINIAKGRYLVTASFTGMEQAYTKIVSIASGTSETDMGVLSLSNANTQLKNVTITAKRPLFEQKTDRTVINVKNSITSAGGTALEVLEKSPGVTVNRQNNSISMNGKAGVTVMINGKINYMPMDVLVQLLASTPANNIEKIELITTPPSKYDASGNGGIINIVLINNPYAGFSGSYFIGAGYGQLRPVGNTGINFNYRQNKINLYGNYAFSHTPYDQPFHYLTEYTRGNDLISNNSFANRDAWTDLQTARIGIDYQPDSATLIGAVLSGYASRWTMVANTGVTISKNNRPDTIITMLDDPEYNKWNNIMTNINFQHSFQPGKTLYADVNYIYYKDDNPNTYSGNYYNSAKEFLYHTDTRGGKITPISFKVFSADYTTPLGKKMNMEAGGKIALSSFTNDVSVENLQQGVWVPDPVLTAHYLLKENIAAAYAAVNINTNRGIVIKAGLRYEYTSSNLGSGQQANIVNRKYGELFPTFNITKKFDAGNSVSISYSRRITRPAYNDLAPFTIFFDPKTFYSGNPALQPAIANTIQAGYGYKNYAFTLSYTDEVNTLGNFIFQSQGVDTVNNHLYLGPRNFKYGKYIIANGSIPVTISENWSMQNNISAGWRKIDAGYGNTDIRFNYFEYSINSTQRLLLPANYSFEVTGLYSYAGYFGTSKAQPIYRVDAGLQKKFSNHKDILTLTANDMFNSGAYYKYAEHLPGGTFIKADFNYGIAAFKLTYTHHFGNRDLKAKQERATGAEDELKRVK